MLFSMDTREGLFEEVIYIIKDLKKAREQAKPTFGDRAFQTGRQQVQRPWGRSVLVIFQEQQRGLCGRHRGNKGESSGDEVKGSGGQIW